MSEQTGEIPLDPNQGGKAQSAKDRASKSTPATAAELRAAIEWSLRHRGSVCHRRARAATKTLDAALAALVPDPVRRALWVGIVAKWLAHRANERGLALKPDFDAAVTAGTKNVVAVKKALTQYDATGPLDEATLTYLDQFTYETKFWIDAGKADTDFAVEITGYLARSKTIEDLLVMFLDALSADHKNLATTLQAAQSTLQAIDGLKIGPFIAPLVTSLTSLCQSAQSTLATCVPMTVAEQADLALAGSFALSFDAQKKVVSDLVPAATSSCRIVADKMSVLMWRLDPDMLNRLALIPTLPKASQTACISVLNVYRVPWITCMASLDPPELTLILERCANKTVFTALRKKVPAADGKLLAMAVQVLVDPVTANPLDWDVACGNLQKMALTEIAVPQGITPITWLSVSGCWMPGSFGTQTMETDLVCLKHMKEEMGVKPSAAKAAAYFADLASACTQACAQWAAAHKPTVFAVSIDIGGATWNIRVRNLFGHPQVFHVDSGYKKSAWVAKTV